MAIRVKCAKPRETEVDIFPAAAGDSIQLLSVALPANAAMDGEQASVLPCRRLWSLGLANLNNTSAIIPRPANVSCEPT